MVPFTYTPPLVCKNSSSSKWWPFPYSSCGNTPFSDKNIFYWGIFISFKIEWENFSIRPQIGGSNILAPTAAKKKAGSYPSCRNTLSCLLKRLYWRKTDIIKIGREIMFSGLTAARGTKCHNYWSKVRATASGTRLCDLYFVELNAFTCFWAFVVPIPAL